MPGADSMSTLDHLLTEVAELLKAATPASRRAAARKLEQVAVIASTLAFTVHRID